MDSIEHRPIKDLKPAPQNSRKHPPEQIDQIAAAIEKFGWTIPVLVDEKGMIIAGHARVLAGKKLGRETAPCIVAAGWSEDQKEAYQIADNRLAEQSSWDEEVLGDQIKRLQAANFDLSFMDMSGFDETLFKPIIDPTFDTSAVTGEQVASTKEKMDGKFQPKDVAAKKEFTVTCPHCSGEFDIEI